MTTRFNSKSEGRYGVQGIQSGYGGLPSPSSLSIPPVGVEDVDIALFNLFDKEIAFQVSTSDKTREELKRVPVIFASSEKWALSKKKGVRDRNGSLVLPLITIIRTTIKQDKQDDITGRGINQQTGEIVVKRRLDSSDRTYQNIVNRSLLKHQLNLAVAPGVADDGQISTLRQLGDLAGDPTISEGGLMLPDKTKNVYETIVIPAPQFYSAEYEVTFWMQYTVQMNQMLEVLVSSFLPQGNAWRLDTQKGYWFIATVDENNYESENNADDMSTEERMLKHKFTVKVAGYILATNVPGAPVPIKRYVSCPEVSFSICVAEDIDSSGEDDPLLGSDDPTLPDDNSGNNRRDQRYTGHTRLYPNSQQVNESDPALNAIPRGQPLQKYRRVISLDKNGNQVSKFVRVVSTNRFTGETVFSPGVDLGGGIELCEMIPGGVTRRIRALPFDPSSLSLTGWWRAAYSGSPWSGVVGSAITEATNPPAVGPMLNSHSVAQFDGVDDTLNAGTWGTYVAAKAASGWMLVYLDPNAVSYGADLLSAPNGGVLIYSYLGDVYITLYDGVNANANAWRSTAANVWQLVTWRYDGVRTEIGVNEVPGASGGFSSSTEYSGDITPLTGNVTIGTGIGAATPLAGRIAEIGLSNTVLSNTDFANIISYINTRYALSL